MTKLTIIGCGPGAPDLITIRGMQAIKKADLIAGSKRLIETFSVYSPARTMIIDKNYTGQLEKLRDLPEESKKILLVSGDPLFSSLGALAVKKFGKERCEVVPGISSFQQAFASLKEAWTDHRIISLHGKEGRDIKKIFSENSNFVLLLDPSQNLKYIKEAVGEKTGNGYSYRVASNLSLPEEEINELSFEELTSHPEQSLSILIVKKKPSETAQTA